MSKPQTIVIQQKGGCSDGCALIIILILVISGIVVWATMQAGKAVNADFKRQEAEKADKAKEVVPPVAPATDQIPWE